VPTAAVVEDFAVVEHRVRQLEAGAPALAVEELDLHAGPEGLDDGVVVAVADGPHRGHQPRLLGAGGEGPGAELQPWWEWMIVPAGGRRASIAIPRALVTSAAVGEESIDQPTTRREHTSSTTAQ